MKYSSQSQQLTLDGFGSSLDDLPKDNRWVKIGDKMPWAEIERLYNSRLNNIHCGAGNKPARVIIGALIVKHKMNLSDEETIQAIQENPYMQYMLGLPAFTTKRVFDPSLFVTIRKRLGMEDFNSMSEELLKQLLEKARKEKADQSKSQKNDDGQGTAANANSSEPSGANPVFGNAKPNKGLMKIDATCCNAEVRYPIDLDLLNDGLEVIDRIFDKFCKKSGIHRPVTHLKELHSAYLNVIKLRRKPKTKLNACKELLLTHLNRNYLALLNAMGKVKGAVKYIKPHDLQLLFTVRDMWKQQRQMFKDGTHQCKDRIISIFQPHVRPIVRGKSKAKIEFGAKVGASVVEGFTFIDHHSWDAYNESEDLLLQLRLYKRRWGCLPAKVEADKIYMNRWNRQILRLLGIEIGGKPLGRPSKEQQTQEYRDLMAKNVGERNEVEATFGTSKRIYRADNIRAKLPDTGESWACACFFVKNLKKFIRELLFALMEICPLGRRSGLRMALFENYVQFARIPAISAICW